jgi:hypothetical protein
MTDLQRKIDDYKHMMDMLDQKRQAIAELVLNLEDVISLEHRTQTILDGKPEAKAVVRHSKKAKKVAAKVVNGKGAMVPMSSLKDPLSLPALALQIVKHSSKPLTVQEVAQLAIDRGYKTAAKRFANNVYQTLNKHVRNKHISQHTVDGKIRFSA